MNNPEFKRNLWLELSPQRLVLMPAVLGIIAALIVYLSGEDGSAKALLYSFAVIGVVLVGAWGSFAVVASVNSEISERTWDQQRLSALSPWQMAWGKLLGSSIYPWFGGLLCTAVVLISAVVVREHLERVIILTFAAILGILALHSWFMALRLYTMDANAANNDSPLIKRLFGIYIFLQFVPGMLIALFAVSSKNDLNTQFAWWGLPLGFSSLCLLMAVLLLALGLLALWRSMSAQLMVHSTPWAWALGCTATGLMIAGFAYSPNTSKLCPAIVAVLAITSCYFALFTEKNNAMVWRAVIFHFKQGNWRRMLQILPLWVVSCVLALVFIVLYMILPGTLTKGSAANQAEMISAIWQVLLMCLLHAVRDAGIFLFFAWRNTKRKPLGMAALTYFILGVVLPMFFMHGDKQLAVIFEPMYNMSTRYEDLKVFSLSAWASMLVHLGVVAALLVWRWNQSVRLQNTPDAD